MTKFTVTERLAAVIAVEKDESLAVVAKRSQMSEDVLSRSIGLYREHGQAGLTSRIYNWIADQKYQVLSFMYENHLSFKETSIQFGISGSSTVWKWERRNLEDGISGLEDKKKGSGQEPESRSHP